MIKKIKSILSKTIILILLIIILFSLIFTKVNYYPINQTKSYLIKINDDKIDIEEFKKLYNFSLLEYEKKFNLKKLNNLHNESYKKKIYKTVISNIIYQTLLKQYVSKLNIILDNDEVKHYIYNEQLFKENNIFSIKKYYTFLNIENLSSNEYIKKIRDNLKIKKFLSLISDSIFISKKEIDNFIKLFSQIRIIRTTSINLYKIFEKLNTDNKNIINNLINHNFNALLIKKYKNDIFLIFKKTTYQNRRKLTKILKKIQLKFKKPLFFSRFNTSKFKTFIFNLPNLKKNKKSYFGTFKNNGNLFLIQFYKTKYMKFSSQQKNNIISQFKEYNLERILSSILDDLYKKAHISYGELKNS
ncbi:MAG: SurA N-terminal domain-containing protein [Buchnera aphidicola (Nurudea shiraii)]